MPLTSIKGEVIGAAQFLNKVDGEFTSIDLETVHAMAQQAAVVLQNNIVIEKMDKSRAGT